MLAAEARYAARIERTVYPSTGVALLDVIHPSVGKAEALSFLQERWGIASAETLAIGDNWNDLEMVEGAGLGFLMGNAPAELLAGAWPRCRRTTRTGSRRRSSSTSFARAPEV